MIPALPSESRNFLPLRSTSMTPPMVTRKLISVKSALAKMRVQIGKAGLNQNRRIVTDDGIDAGELVARQDDAGQHETERCICGAAAIP